jgi:beta-lactam-binding protein with PASTA domain
MAFGAQQFLTTFGDAYMKKPRLLILVVLLYGILAGTVTQPPALAQDDQVTVPDVTGLSVPAAAALLNRNGMALGLQTEEPWNESLGQPGNTIIGQSLAPGSTAARGTALDVTVLRSPNMLLV